MPKLYLIAFTLLLLPLMSSAMDESALLQRAETAWREGAYLELTEMADSLTLLADLSDEERARWQLRTGIAYHTLERPVKAIAAFTSVQTLSDDPKVLAEAAFRSGEIYFEQRSLNRALDHYSLALRHYEDAGSQKEATAALFKTAMIYRKNGDAELAENLLRRIIRSSEVDDVRKAVAMTELGRVFYDVAEFDSSATYFKQSNAIYERFNLRSETLENYEQLIYVNVARGNNLQARSFAAKAADVAMELHNAAQSVFYLERLSDLFAESGDLRQAISYREQALEYVGAAAPDAATSLYYGLSDLYGRSRQDAEALLSFNDAEHQATKHDLTEWRERIARRKAEFFSKRDRYKEAFVSMHLADSLRQALSLAALREARAQSAADPFVTEPYARMDGDTRTQLEEQRYKRMRNLVVLGLIIFTAAITLLLREFSQKRKLSKVLEWKVYKRTRELRKANKELNTYIYKSSHDLRTPLTSIKSLLRLLEKEEHNASTKKYLGLISSCTDQMDDILVNLSRAVDYKKVDVRVEQIDFNKIRYQIAEKELAGLQSMRVEWDISENGAFYSDFKLLKVILQQTIANAVAYRKGTPEDYCKVTVKTDPEGAFLTIEDNGQGIPEKVRDKVFEMFVKGTHKSTGAGLGLYLVRIAAEKIRAQVKLDSEENQGCVLTFQLPNLN